MGNSFFRCIPLFSETLQVSPEPVNSTIYSALQDMVSVSFGTRVNLGKVIHDTKSWEFLIHM